MQKSIFKLHVILLAVLISALSYANEDANGTEDQIPDPDIDIKVELTTACLLQGVFDEKLPLRLKFSSYYREWSRKEMIKNITLEDCELRALEIANLDDGIWDVKHEVVYKTISARMWFKDFESGELVEDEVHRISLR